MRKQPENNFHLMLAALIAFLVVLPFLEDFEVVPDELVQPIAISCLVAIGVWSLRISKTIFRTGIALMVIAIVMAVSGSRKDTDIAYYATLVPFAAFLVLSIGASLRQVLFGERMTTNRLIGVVCVYLQIGILWATIYAVIFRYDPSAFAGLDQRQTAEVGTTWAYYSFVTLTTLGYGDVLPVSVTARVLAFTEAIVGVFYMATLVAMLVSAYAAEAESDQDQ